MDSTIQLYIYYTNGHKRIKIKKYSKWHNSHITNAIQIRNYTNQMATGINISFLNGDNTQTAQRLQPYHHWTQLYAIILIHSITISMKLQQQHQLTDNQQWYTDSNCRLSKWSHHNIPIILISHQNTNPLNQNTLTQWHTVRIWNKDCNLHWLGLDTD